MSKNITQNSITSAVPLDCLVSCFDKQGTPIKPGSIVLIENDRKDYSETGVVQHDGAILLITGREKGKYTRVESWLDTIWWRNDTSSNWLLVLES